VRAAADEPEDLSRRALKSHRPVCFDADDDNASTPIYWRPDLLAGDRLHGPAVIEEFGSTVPLHPGFTARVDSIGNLVITKEA
jgi:N-methylhydantoinase A